MAEYKVQLDIYNGPLDLLLFLIRRNELDIYDIPIASVTRQYCDYVRCLHQIDPETAADFIVMATVLMEIKSRLLLPRPPDEEAATTDDLSDPRMELVRQLLQYKRFKDASIELRDAAAEQALRWPRNPIDALASAPVEYDLDDMQVWDLVAAFNKLMLAIGSDRATHDVVFDDTPIALHATDIQDRLSREGNLPFAGIFAGRGRAEMIGLFLALLELIRQHRIRVEQPDILGPILVVLLSAEPITVGTEWEYRGEPTTEPSESNEPHSDRPTASPERLHEATTPFLGPADDADEEKDELLAKLNSIPTDVDIDLAGDGSSPKKTRRPDDTAEPDES